ncbi:MAG: hypothetical protein Ct9H300mP31_03990 [Acidimicrobiaceae bacterium]|nr:MAG: hypothetical protein Ct9H300mP31_03990 [Acidimicrobiaceae bacterium]
MGAGLCWLWGADFTGRGGGDWRDDSGRLDIHRTNGFFIIKEGWEYVFVLASVSLAVGPPGPRSWSVDDALGIAGDMDGMTGFWVALVIGVGAASPRC